jgi:hypothetical protein
VFLWNADRGVKLEATPGVDGSYRFDAPRDDLTAARILVEGASGATTTTGKLDVAPLATAVVVAPLALFRARVDVKREGERLRFSWSPFSEVPAERLRYSLIFVYTSVRDGGSHPADATLVTREPEAIQSLGELSEILPERDPSAKTIVVRARAYDAADANGPTWAGEPLDWTLPDDFPPPLEARH